jgi:hypothetical protein
MLSLARSRHTLLVQFVFLVTNAVGILLSVIYNANTPDLYPNNAHHKVGWIATWVVGAQAVVGLLGRVAGAYKGQAERVTATAERESFIPVSRAAMEEHHRLNDQGPYRLSDDSGQGTEPKTESLRSHSVSTNGDSSEMRDVNMGYREEDDDYDLEGDLPSFSRRGRVQSLVRKAVGMVSTRAWKVMMFGYNFVDRTILILGFITFTLGIATYGRFFVSSTNTPILFPHMLTRNRRAIRSSLVWLTGSTAESSFGSVF